MWPPRKTICPCCLGSTTGAMDPFRPRIESRPQIRRGAIDDLAGFEQRVRPGAECRACGWIERRHDGRNQLRIWPLPRDRATARRRGRDASSSRPEEIHRFDAEHLRARVVEPTREAELERPRHEHVGRDLSSCEDTERFREVRTSSHRPSQLLRFVPARPEWLRYARRARTRRRRQGREVHVGCRARQEGRTFDAFVDRRFGKVRAAKAEQAADLYALTDTADWNERMEFNAGRVDGLDSTQGDLRRDVLFAERKFSE